MATDKTNFDDFLKEKLCRDIAFRVIIWSVINITAAYYASERADFDLFDYFQSSFATIESLVNSVGVVAVILVFPALMLKDLEHVKPCKWGYGTRASWWGGFIRRLAGDLILWVVGAFVTLFVLTVWVNLAEWKQSDVGARDVCVFAYFYTLLFAFIVVLSGANVFVRRKEPVLAGRNLFNFLVTTPSRVVATYAGLGVMGFVIIIFVAISV